MIDDVKLRKTQLTFVLLLPFINNHSLPLQRNESNLMRVSNGMVKSGISPSHT